MIDEMHVTPVWQNHDLSSACWCQPIYEADLVTGGRVWVHRAALDHPHRYDDESIRRTMGLPASSSVETHDGE